MARKDLEQQRKYSRDLRQDGFVICLGSIVPCLGEVLQEDLVLLVSSPSFLGIKVFAEDGSLAGQIVLFSRVEDGIEKAFEEVQA
jgi:hypothetical protein